jgi:arsenate reductase-like glutaredoxin family protein
MIDEVFLKSAVNIRREYLKISNNMELYHNKAKDVVSKLENTLQELDNLQNDFSVKKSVSNESAVNRLMTILKEVEDEGDRLEKLVEPMNQKMEILSKEEHELYRLIKEKHTDLTDEQIVESVQDRLIKEGL